MRWLAIGVLLMMGDSVLADIRTTPHSLVRQSISNDAMDVCVFCHTPTLNAGNGGLQRITPVWQHSLSDQHSFTIYDDIGRLQFGDKPAVGSQSIACLSCHDANQAFSVTKFSYDHPFGVPYRGFSKHGQAAPEVRKDGEAPAVEAKYLKAVDDFRQPSNAVVDNRKVWWVSSSGNPVLRSRNDLPLYARPDALTGNEVPFIECSSCHDPHTTNPLFLRVSNEGSRLCLTCHDK